MQTNIPKNALTIKEASIFKLRKFYANETAKLFYSTFFSFLHMSNAFLKSSYSYDFINVLIFVGIEEKCFFLVILKNICVLEPLGKRVGTDISVWC